MVENIDGCACNHTLCEGSLHVIDGDTQKGNESKVFVFNGHNNFFFDLKVLLQTSEKIGLEGPTIKSQFYYHEVLKRGKLKVCR